MRNLYKTLTLTLVSIFAILLFQGCTKSPQIVHEEELHVDVLYLDRKMLPPNAKVTLILEDISKQDVKSKVIAKQSIIVKNAPPYSFTMKYDYNSIDMKKVYNLSANITINGKYLYRSDTVLNPFTDILDKYELIVKKVPKETHTKPNSDLQNTYWKLVKLENKNVKVLKNMKEPYILFENDGKSVKGFGGCNSMFGSFKKDKQHIEIGPLASTRKACLRGMDTEAKFQKALGETQMWYIQGEVLKLTDAYGKTLAELKAVYF